MNQKTDGFKKSSQRKIKMVTAYDATFARLIHETDVDWILVGDSCANVIHGFDSTIHATIEMMVAHTAAVARAKPKQMIIADMPFMSLQRGQTYAIDCATALVRAGATAVKIEGHAVHEEYIKILIRSGIPVMGHVGLTPQFSLSLGGMKVQGKTADEKDWILSESKGFEKSGVFSIVLECIPAALAAEITKVLKIPTIGIGAGQEVDGQVLVTQDLLGLNTKFKPKFLRHFGKLGEGAIDALQRFCIAVDEKTYPDSEETYG